MAAEKIKLKDLVQPGTFVSDALGEAKLNKDGELTPTEMERVEKKVVERILKAVDETSRVVLKNGDSIEFPGMLNIKKTASSVYKNKNGEPKERLTIRTRTQFLKDLNNEA